jgi:hypothetical protein
VPRIVVRPHARDQRDDVLGRDLVERHFAERGQDMDAQHRLVGAPASFIGFDKRQIFLGHELGQARNRPQLLAAQLRIFPKHGAGEN